MGPIDNAEPERLHARQAFARRLKALRVARGFATARSLAKALDIDENRYTRYERAEVEPDIGLLSQICITLGITPDDLLGFSGLADGAVGRSGDGAVGQGASGFAEADGDGATPRRQIAPIDAVQASAWTLAQAVVHARLRHAAPTGHETHAGDKGAGDAVAVVKSTLALQSELLAAPYAAISRIVDDPAVAGAPAGSAHTIAELVRQLTEALSKAARAG